MPTRTPATAPTVGLVSLGCPKALVDSEQIVTRLKMEGYRIAEDYQQADMVVVNTCGFIDQAKAESLEAIGEALDENGKVLVAGGGHLGVGDMVMVRIDGHDAYDLSAQLLSKKMKDES